MKPESLRRAIAAAVVSLGLLCGCMGRNGDAGRYTVVEGAMIGTTFRVSAELADASEEDIRAAMQQIEEEARASMSIFDEESLLCRINRSETDSLDCHLLRNFRIARQIGESIDSRYDITVKPLTEALGFAASEASANPDLDSLLTFVGYDKWSLDGGRVVKADPRVQFDLNSIAKGYTVDMAAEMLESMGAVNYLVEIGGEIRCRGVNPSGEPWKIGIDSPYDGNYAPGENMCAMVRLRDRSLATSGNYRRFHLDANGRKIVHTIDPRTGESVTSRLLSATVVAPNCAEADALATMFMAVGADDAIALAGRMKDSIDVYFILDGGDEYEIFTTIEQ